MDETHHGFTKKDKQQQYKERKGDRSGKEWQEATVAFDQPHPKIIFDHRAQNKSQNERWKRYLANFHGIPENAEKKHDTDIEDAASERIGPYNREYYNADQDDISRKL